MEDDNTGYDNYKLTARYFNKHIYTYATSPEDNDEFYWNHQDLVIAIQRSREYVE